MIQSFPFDCQEVIFVIVEILLEDLKVFLCLHRVLNRTWQSQQFLRPLFPTMYITVPRSLSLFFFFVEAASRHHSFTTRPLNVLLSNISFRNMHLFFCQMSLFKEIFWHLRLLCTSYQAFKLQLAECRLNLV
jgi:hypothetical protein